MVTPNSGIWGKHANQRILRSSQLHLRVHINLASSELKLPNDTKPTQEWLIAEDMQQSGFL